MKCYTKSHEGSRNLGSELHCYDFYGLEFERDCHVIRTYQYINTDHNVRNSVLKTSLLIPIILLIKYLGASELYRKNKIKNGCNCKCLTSCQKIHNLHISNPHFPFFFIYFKNRQIQSYCNQIYNIFPQKLLSLQKESIFIYVMEVTTKHIRKRLDDYDLLLWFNYLLKLI